MSGSTRRNFLIASGAGAAAVGAAAAIPAAAQAGPSQSASVVLPGDAQPLVAHVSDPDTGILSLLVGEREIVVRDPDLVARLARAAATASNQEA